VLTTNPTWTDLWLNPGLRGDRPPTNRLGDDSVLPLSFVVSLFCYQQLAQWTLSTCEHVLPCGNCDKFPNVSRIKQLAQLALRNVPVTTHKHLLSPCLHSFATSVWPTCSAKHEPLRPHPASYQTNSDTLLCRNSHGTSGERRRTFRPPPPTHTITLFVLSDKITLW
jgi:hypothetical protein